MFSLKIRYSVIMYRTLILLVLPVVIIGCSTSDTEKSAPPTPTPKAVSVTTPIMPPETPTPVIPQVEPTPINTPLPALSQDFDTAVNAAMENLEQLRTYLATIDLDIRFSGDNFFMEMPVNLSFTVESEEVMSSEMSMSFGGNEETHSSIRIGDDIYSKENDSPWVLESLDNLLDSDQYTPFDRYFRNLLSNLGDGYSSSLTQTMSGNEYTITMDYIPEFIVEFMESLEYGENLLKGTTKYSINRSSNNISKISFDGVPFSMKDDTMGEVNVEINASYTFSEWNKPTIKITAPNSFINVGETYSGSLAPVPVPAQAPTSTPTSPPTPTPRSTNLASSIINLDLKTGLTEKFPEDISGEILSDGETDISVEYIYPDTISDTIPKGTVISFKTVNDDDDILRIHIPENWQKSEDDDWFFGKQANIFVEVFDYNPEDLDSFAETFLSQDSSYVERTRVHNTLGVTNALYEKKYRSSLVSTGSIKGVRPFQIHWFLPIFSESPKIALIRLTANPDHIDATIPMFASTMNSITVTVSEVLPTPSPAPTLTPTKPVDSFANMYFDISDPIELPEESLIVAHGNNGLLVYDVQLGIFVGPSDPVPFGWVNAMDSSPDGDLFVSFNTSDGQHYWGVCEEAGCRGIISIDTSSFSVQKGFNKARWLLGGPSGGGDLEYLITDILYHDGKLYIATDSKRHMVQVNDAKSGASLGQINLPEFHPAAIALSLDKQDLLIVSAEDSKIYQMNVNSPADSIQEYADFAQYMEQGGAIRMEFSPNDGALMLANFHENLLIAFQAVSGKYLGGHTYLKECHKYTDNDVCGPLDLEFEPGGTLFISNWNWDEVSKYSSPNYKEQELVDTVSATAIEYMHKP